MSPNVPTVPWTSYLSPTVLQSGAPNSPFSLIPYFFYTYHLPLPRPFISLLLTSYPFFRSLLKCCSKGYSCGLLNVYSLNLLSVPKSFKFCFYSFTTLNFRLPWFNSLLCHFLVEEPQTAINFVPQFPLWNWDSVSHRVVLRSK